MVREAQEHSAEDKKFEELANARNRADATVHAMKKQLNDTPNAPASVKESVQKAIAELELAIRGDDKDKIEACEKKVMESAQGLMQAAQANAQAQQQQSAQGASAGSSQNKADDGVVDAEFEEVKDDKK